MSSFSGEDQIVFKKDINPFIVSSKERDDALYILGLMNSKLISYLYINTSTIATKDDFRQTTLAELRNLPLPRFDYAKNKGIYSKLVDLVNQMLNVQKDLYFTNKEMDKGIYQQKISTIDKQIDRLVYELYGLSEDEIKIVEGAGWTPGT